MDIEVRPIRDEEFGQLVTVDARTFGITYSDTDADDLHGWLELDRMLVGVDGADIVATAGAWTFELTVPGGAYVPTAGVTWVGVTASHRRRGILRSLMARLHDHIAERGEPVAALTASESGIYGRFGYGVATRRARLVVASTLVRLRGGIGDDGAVRYVDAGTARKVLPAIYDRARAQQPGTLSRNDRWWDYMLLDRESNRGGASALFFVVHPDGYAMYRARNAWSKGFPNGEIVLLELMTASFEAYAALWRFLLDVDLVERISTSRSSPDEILPWLVDDPRRVQTEALWDDAWVRVLDVPAALSARRYLTEDRLVVEVVDPSRPATSGRYEVDGGPSGATSRRTTVEPDLVMDISALGSLYLGGVPATTLGRARLIEECTTGALRRADAFFASDPPAHNQTGF